jgi:hypothetical protein
MPENQATGRRPVVAASLAVFVIVVALAGAASRGSSAPSAAPQGQGQGPASKQAAVGSPSSRGQEQRMEKAPQIFADEQRGRASAKELIDWAGRSTPAQREEARATFARAKENKVVVDTLCEEAFAAQKTDHSRALVVLAILGETRSPHAERCLARFLDIPFPQGGKATAEGEIPEQTALATLQAKAVDGLAYLGSRSADELVLKQVREHPSIIVRAEAIAAYLYNKKNSPEARAALLRHVRKGEEIHLDRVAREEGETKDSFNRKLDVFLKKHPEVHGRGPEKSQNPDKQKEEKQADRPNPPKH